ncbi:MAG: O-antigen ligase family protein [Acidobacteriota bacterium]|nr:O-antigen ligase family protein [Acidobacteriota bacterium]
MAAAAIAWSYFAFGAVYEWAAPPLLLLSITALLLARAWPRPRRLADAAALAALAIVALQLVPVPPALGDILSPDARAFRGQVQLAATASAWAPLSLDPALTRVSLMLAGSALALFLAVREISETHGRALARWIAWMALVACCLGIGKAMLFPDGRIYGFWTPIERGAAPFGAIINRNHFAAWAVAAIGIIGGALAAHVTRRAERAAPRRRAVAVLSDGRTLWLVFAPVLLTASIVLTASRAGFAGLLGASGAALALTRTRLRARTLSLFAVLGAACLIAALSWARPDRLLSRVAGEGSAPGARAAIWRETAAIAARYPVAGVGLGAFPSAMAVYQRGPRTVFFNHAHNQYLELAAEGGIVLSVALLLFAWAVARRTVRGLATDQGSYFWLRAGGGAALVGMAILSIWESPFRTPATLMISAVAAGLAATTSRR